MRTKFILGIFLAFQIQANAEGTRTSHYPPEHSGRPETRAETSKRERPYDVMLRKYGEDAIHNSTLTMSAHHMFSHPVGTDDLLTYSVKRGAAKYKIIEPKYKANGWTPSDQTVWVRNQENVKVLLDLENLRDITAAPISESQDSSLEDINQLAQKFGWASSSLERSPLRMASDHLVIQPRRTNRLLVKSSHPSLKSIGGMAEFTLVDPDNFQLNGGKVKVLNSKGQPEEIDLDAIFDHRSADSR